MVLEYSFEVLKTPTGFLKICQLMLTILMMSIGQGMVGNYGNDGRNFIVGGAMILSLVSSWSFLIGYIRGETQVQKTRMELRLNIVNAMLMITAGSLILNTYTANVIFNDLEKRGAALTVGSFGIINFVFYAVDIYFAHQNFVN